MTIRTARHCLAHAAHVAGGLAVIAGVGLALAAYLALIGALLTMPQPPPGRVISVESDGTTHD